MDGVVLPVGSRWRDVATGRVVAVIAPGPSSPWLRHEGDPPEKTFYCCLEDFTVWNRFVPEPEPGKE